MRLGLVSLGLHHSKIVCSVNTVGESSLKSRCPPPPPPTLPRSIVRRQKGKKKKEGPPKGHKSCYQRLCSEASRIFDKAIIESLSV
jgi:hypothetical protein